MVVPATEKVPIWEIRMQEVRLNVAKSVAKTVSKE